MYDARAIDHESDRVGEWSDQRSASSSLVCMGGPCRNPSGFHGLRWVEMTHYEILQISESASPQVIEAAWKALLKIHHSDVAGGDAEKAKQLNHAHDVLADQQKRKIYDDQLAAGRQFEEARRSYRQSQNRRDPFSSGAYNQAYPDPMYGVNNYPQHQPETIDDFMAMGLEPHGLAHQLGIQITEQLIGLVFHRLPPQLREPFMKAVNQVKQSRRAG
jgi:curved DNA-binding protein CbpA